MSSISSPTAAVKFTSTPLTPYLNRGLEFSKVRAQERRVRLSDRQRIGRDGCVQAILAQFLQLSESDQDEWIDKGVAVLLKQS